MNFQQLRSFREAIRQGYNLTAVAQALSTSQPGVSRQLIELEDELGLPLFERAGRRLVGLTAAGRVVAPIIDRLLTEAGNLSRAAEDFRHSDQGLLRVAATHTQARYALPAAVKDFCDRHPEVSLHLVQGSPSEIARLVLSGDADLGIATESLADHPGLVALPCYRWTHAIVVPAGHVLQREADEGRPPTLARLAEFPLITYEPGYTGRGHIDAAFAREGLRARFVLQAMDADVIKTYAALGLGVGLIASMAYDEERDTGLAALDARHLFPLNTTRVALRRGAHLRGYVHAFVETFAPTLTRGVVEAALREPPPPPAGDPAAAI